MASGFVVVNAIAMFFVEAGVATTAGAVSMAGAAAMAGALSGAGADPQVGVPVVYVHGNTGSSIWFSLVMNVPGCHVVALDMPNFGQSSPLEGDISIQRYAAYVAGFMDAKGLKGAVVVGHSLGGCVVQALALERPDLVKAMVLVDSGAPNGLITPKDRHPAIELMRTNRAVLEQALRAVVPTLKNDELFKAIVDDAQKMAQPAWIGNAEALSHFDITARCAEYKGPVLVIRGALDPIITADMAETTAKAYPGARLVTLEGVGHSVIVEQPDTFVRLLGDFVGEHVTAR